MRSLTRSRTLASSTLLSSNFSEPVEVMLHAGLKENILYVSNLITKYTKKSTGEMVEDMQTTRFR
jgi:hypothetical protein